jgi:TRAP-type C4-dicarboxylate transport system permease large subunit
MIPFYIAMLAALAIITYVPWVTLALPQALGYAK